MQRFLSCYALDQLLSSGLARSLVVCTSKKLGCMYGSLPIVRNKICRFMKCDLVRLRQMISVSFQKCWIISTWNVNGFERV